MAQSLDAMLADQKENERKLRDAVRLVNSLSNTSIGYEHGLPVRVWIVGYEGNGIDAPRIRRKKQLDDEGLEFLVDAMPALRTVQLWGTNVTDEGFRHLRSLGRLEKLQLADSDQLTNASIAKLQGVSTLRDVGFYRCPNFTFAALEYFAASKDTLRKLHLSGPGFTDNDVELVTQFPHLETLDLINCNVSNAAVKHLLEL